MFLLLKIILLHLDSIPPNKRIKMDSEATTIQNSSDIPGLSSNVSSPSMNKSSQLASDHSKLIQVIEELIGWIKSA